MFSGGCGSSERGGADGLGMLLTNSSKLVMLLSELMMLSRLGESELLAAGVEGAGLSLASALAATALAASANPGMVVEILSVRLSMGGGAEGAEALKLVATPARDGMLAAMRSVIPSRVGKLSRVDFRGEERGRASSSGGRRQ